MKCYGMLCFNCGIITIAKNQKTANKYCCLLFIGSGRQEQEELGSLMKKGRGFYDG